MKAIWTIVIVIVALVVLGYGGYRVYHHYTWKPTSTPTAMTQTTMQPKPTAKQVENSVYKSVNDPKLGMIMKDPKGMTLYTFTNDTSGKSNCTGACADNWPVYSAPSQTGTFPANISVIKRADGTFQYAWKGMPLYYFAKDKDSGDAYGQGVKGVWWVVKL